MTPEDEVIEAYRAERDTALQQDVEAMLWLMTKYKMPLPSSRHAAEIQFHKARTAIVTLPMNLRSDSKRWLLARGYTPYDDGDVPT